MPKAYRGFIIDADNTLLDFDRAERQALVETLEAVSFDFNLDEACPLFSKINQSLWRDFEEGKLDRDTLKIKRFKLLLAALSMKEDPEALAASYLERLSRMAFLINHASEVLVSLSKRASLALVTNGISKVQRGRIGGSGIGAFFQAVFISEEIGISKPDPEIFRKALMHLRIPRHEVLCVGDSPSSDIRGGWKAGIDTCWFMHQPRSYPLEEPEPNYIIKDLRQLNSFAPGAH